MAQCCNSLGCLRESQSYLSKHFVNRLKQQMILVLFHAEVVNLLHSRRNGCQVKVHYNYSIAFLQTVQGGQSLIQIYQTKFRSFERSVPDLWGQWRMLGEKGKKGHSFCIHAIPVIILNKQHLYGCFGEKYKGKCFYMQSLYHRRTAA